VIGTSNVKHPLMQEKFCRRRSTLDLVFILCNIDGCMIFHHFLGGGMV